MQQLYTKSTLLLTTWWRHLARMLLADGDVIP